MLPLLSRSPCSTSFHQIFCCIAVLLMALFPVRGLQVASNTTGQRLAPLMSTSSRFNGMAALIADYRHDCLEEDESEGGIDAPSQLALSEESVGNSQDLSSPASGRKPVLWVHLHNFAGTYICKEAARQNEWGTPGANCLLEMDRCSTQSQDKRVHCHERAQFVNTNSFTMVERDVEDDDFCPELITGIMLRDPIAGARSTLRNNKMDKTVLMEVLQSGQAGAVPHRGCLPTWDGYQHFDNFAVRSLSGSYNVRPGGISKKHYLVAKGRLLSMDIIMILEELSDHFPQLEQYLGWDTSLMTPSEPYNSHCGPHGASWSHGEKAFLKALNKWDFKLYALGRRLAAKRTKAALSGR